MGDILKETNQISEEKQKEIDDHNLACLKKYTYMTGSLAKKAFNTEQDYYNFIENIQNYNNKTVILCNDIDISDVPVKYWTIPSPLNF